MSNSADDDGYQQYWTKLRLIYGAMLSSTIVYSMIGCFLNPKLSEASEYSRLLIRAIYFGAAGIISAIMILRRKLIAPIAETSSFQGPKDWMPKLRAAYIVLYCLCEAIALLGLVILFIAGSTTHFAILIALSLALMLSLFPRGAIAANR